MAYHCLQKCILTVAPEDDLGMREGEGGEYIGLGRWIIGRWEGRRKSGVFLEEKREGREGCGTNRGDLDDHDEGVGGCFS